MLLSQHAIIIFCECSLSVCVQALRQLNLILADGPQLAGCRRVACDRTERNLRILRYGARSCNPIPNLVRNDLDDANPGVILVTLVHAVFEVTEPR